MSVDESLEVCMKLECPGSDKVKEVMEDGWVKSEHGGAVRVMRA